MKIEYKCKNCKCEINSNRKFCSSSCAASFNNTKRQKKDQGQCLNCGNDLNYVQVKFCSRECNKEHKHKNEVIPKLKDGSLVSSRIIKKHLLEERGNKCEGCGITEWNGQPIVLQLHHIDGNFKNNIPKNIKLLCPNCHSQTDTFTGRNKGNGRQSRKLLIGV